MIECLLTPRADLPFFNPVTFDEIGPWQELPKLSLVTGSTESSIYRLWCNVVPLTNFFLSTSFLATAISRSMVCCLQIQRNDSKIQKIAILAFHALYLYVAYTYPLVDVAMTVMLIAKKCLSNQESSHVLLQSIVVLAANLLDSRRLKVSALLASSLFTGYYLKDSVLGCSEELGFADSLVGAGLGLRCVVRTFYALRLIGLSRT
jgi:hypothetical protein